MSNLAQAYASVAAEDRTPFPIEDANTSCWGRGLMAGAIGIPLAMFIAFFSIQPDTNTAPEIPGQPKASLWKRNVEVFRLTGVRGWQSGKNFFWLGLAWSGTECAIEKVRGKSDHWNSTLAAVTTGVMLSWRGGVAPMIISSAGMAALAFAGDMAMRGSHRPSSLFSGE